MNIVDEGSAMGRSFREQGLALCARPRGGGPPPRPLELGWGLRVSP